MSKSFWWLIAALGCGLFALILYFTRPALQPAPPPEPTTTAPAEPQIRHPVAQQAAEKPLPALDVSDTTLKNALDELPLDAKLVELLQLQGFVRRVVATIDNLPREKLALRLMPVKQAGGKFLVTGKDDSLTLGTNNATRYALYLQLTEAIDSEKLVGLYLHFYPLFQQAYQELGYPQGYFNDRVFDVIDHLLATPELKGPIKLAQPKVFYVFADPALEARSAGQKILMRMGRDNAATIEAKLRDLRDELTRQAPER